MRNRWEKRSWFAVHRNFLSVYLLTYDLKSFSKKLIAAVEAEFSWKYTRLWDSFVLLQSYFCLNAQITGTWKESYDVKKKEENRKYYNWFRYELFNDKKQIFLDNNHIMCESIFLRYKNLSSFCGWIKFDVRFFFRLCRANNYDENYPIARSFNNKWNFSLFVVFFLYYIFIIFLTYVSSYIDQIWIKFELKN